MRTVLLALATVAAMFIHGRPAHTMEEPRFEIPVAIERVDLGGTIVPVINPAYLIFLAHRCHAIQPPDTADECMEELEEITESSIGAQESIELYRNSPSWDYIKASMYLGETRGYAQKQFRLFEQFQLKYRGLFKPPFLTAQNRQKAGSFLS